MYAEDTEVVGAAPALTDWGIITILLLYYYCYYYATTMLLLYLLPYYYYMIAILLFYDYYVIRMLSRTADSAAEVGRRPSAAAWAREDPEAQDKIQDTCLYCILT